MTEGAPGQGSTLARALRAIETLEAKLDAAERRRHEPIAIVGMGCRLPGGVHGPDDFRRLLNAGVDAVTEVPADRWDAAALYDADPDAPGRMSTRWFGSLEGVDRFDPRFFGISPREAAGMDPQQRLALEVAWEALEHAGMAPGGLSGSRTGVFMGAITNDYDKRFLDLREIDAYFAAGISPSLISGRISYVLGLQGPSMTVDTACSSSLVAVHLAVQSLRAGESDLALAGGVNLILYPDVSIGYSKARMMAPDGRCKTFDAAADGFVRGEGCGVVVLKPLADAERDGDPVVAVIRGTAVNQDGPSSTLTAPNGPAQEAVIRAALADGGVDPAAVGYVEAHGTGTSLGDPIELRALGGVFAGRPADRPVRVGSVKANVGHLESAAGVAGLIKLALAVRHGELAPQLHYRTPNPHVEWDRIPVAVCADGGEWRESSALRVGGVSSFGFSGTNAHVVVQQAPERVAPVASNVPAASVDTASVDTASVDIASAPSVDSVESTASADTRPVAVLPLSAATERSLSLLAGAIAERFAADPGLDPFDACFTAGAGRSHFPHRLAVAARSADELRDALAAVAAGDASRATAYGRTRSVDEAKTAFLFTGQGSQYPGMGRALFDGEPVFRRALLRCEEILGARLPRPLTSILYPTADQDAELIHQTACTQPALFALEYALAETWAAWGVRPALVLGHSIGEYVAACRAGVFSLEDALHLVAERGRLMQGLPGGSMAVLFAPEDAVAAALADGFAETLSIAAVNGPRNVVVSGETEAVDAFFARMRERGVDGRRMSVSHAFHSPMMDPVLDEFEAAAATVAYSRPRVPLVSGLTGRLCRGDEACTARYWRDHLRQPVRFADAVRTAAERLRGAAWLEVGPGAPLTALAQTVVDDADALWVSSLRRTDDDWTHAAGALAALYVHGVPVDWAGFDAGRGRRKVALPTYPFDRQRYWAGTAAAPAQAPAASAPGGLLGRRLRSPALPQTVFESDFNTARLPWLDDHRVYGAPVVPGAAYLALAAAGAAKELGACAEIRDFALPQGLAVPAGETRTVQLLLDAEADGACAFRIVSAAAGDDEDAGWTPHAEGTALRAPSAGAAPAAPFDVAAAAAECGDGVEPDAFYAAFAETGIEFGPAFRWIERIHRRDGEAFARLRPATEADRIEGAGFAPGLLDAAFQLTGAAFPGGSVGGEAFLPFAVETLRLTDLAAPAAWCRVRLRGAPGADSATGDLWFHAEDGRVVMEAAGFVVKRARRAGAHPEDRMFDTEWHPREAAASTDAASTTGSPTSTVAGGQATGAWLVMGDRGGMGAELARLLEDAGERCTVAAGVPAEGVAALLRETDLATCRGIVHLGALDAAMRDEHAPAPDAVEAPVAVLHVLQALAAADAARVPPVWMVTRGAQAAAAGDRVDPFQAPLVGLARVAAVEHPEIGCALVDLDPAADAAENARALLAELRAGTAEPVVAVRRGGALVPRLVPASASSADAAAGALEVPAEGAYRLEVRERGTFDGLRFAAFERVAPSAGEVEIEVRATGLMFRDVRNALGMYPGEPGALGGECVGRVAAVGAGVEGFAVGDEVIAIEVPGGFASHVAVDARFVVPRPAGLSAVDAATIPSTFLTAAYGLQTLANVRRGERVLVHAGAGGVGMAAIQLAQAAGAEVIATASRGKWSLLHAMGVRHVLDSRSLDFADGVREATGGEGVDVVLNSLAGDFIPASLGLLRAGGRFLEIGKTGTWSADAVAERFPGIDYHVFDMGELARRDPHSVGGLLRGLGARFSAGELRPLPRRVFSFADAVGAFRFMAAARHVGKVVLVPPVRRSVESEETPFRADASYLVTGGLGSLGLHVARWMADNGARTLVLLGRGAPSAEARAALDAIERAGVAVHVRAADVADGDALAALLAEMDATLPPLRGIVHAAGVLDDGVLAQQGRARFAGVMAPKVRGAWNLHTLSRGRELDCFVLFSSVATVLGSAGQANYAAANAFLDSLAHFRRAQGLAAVSVAWGPWAAGGMASTVGQRDQRRWQERGIGVLEPAAALEILGRVVRSSPAQVTAVALERPRAGGEVQPILRRLARTAPKTAVDARPKTADAPAEALAERVAALPAGERRGAVVEWVSRQAARVLGLDAGEPLDPAEPLSDLGLDSLMAVELRNALAAGVGTRLSATLVYDHPTIDAVADLLLATALASAAAPEPAVPSPSPVPPAGGDALLASIEALSAAELEAMIAEELARLASEEYTT